jgi:hypothetical protein
MSRHWYRQPAAHSSHPKARGAQPARARIRLERLEDRTVPAQIVWDGGPAGTGTVWLTPANWAGDVLPGPNDDAVINAIAGVSTAITVGGSTAVRSATVNTSRDVRLTAGIFSTGAAVSKFYDLALAGGTLDLADGATLAGNAPTYTMTYVEGSTTFTNPAGHTLTLQGVSLNCPVINQGTLLAVGQNSISGALTTTATSVIRLPGLSTPSRLSISSNFTNNGLIELAAGILAPNDVLSVSGTNGLTNAAGGTLSVPAALGGSRNFDVYINNQGTFTVGAGPTVSVYAFNNISDHTLTGGTYNLAAPVSLTGRPTFISINAATVVLDGPTAGFFGGSANLLSTLGANVVGGSLTLRNGRTFTALSPFGNAGQLTVESGSTATATVATNYAATVLDFSSEYSPTNYSATQVLGPPNTTTYGDIPTSWTANTANPVPPIQTLTLGFSAPVFATGAVIRETFNNGFITQIDALDTDGAFHTVFTGTDPSAPGTPVNFNPTWTQTPYLVKGLRLFINTAHTTNYEAIDSVLLQGVGPVGGFTQTAGTTTVNGTVTVVAANLTGGVLTGNGTVNGAVTAAAQVSPGSSPGRLTVNGSFVLPVDGTLVAEINGTTAGTLYDQLTVNGTVTLGGALSAAVAYPSVVNDTYTLINNDGTDAVVGTFAGLPQGTAVALSGLPYRISYAGGTGNDVTLTRLAHAGVASVAVNGGAVQRSRVTEVTVTFNTLVTLSVGQAQAIQVARTGPGTPTGNVTLSLDLSGSTATQTVARLTFGGSLAEVGSLKDGTYTLTVFGALVTGPGGLALDGDNNGVAGGDFVYGTDQSLEKLYRFFGDINGDRFVNGADFAFFRTAFGTSFLDPNYNAAFDVNGDGFINGADFLPFRTNFGGSI